MEIKERGCKGGKRSRGKHLGREKKEGTAGNKRRG
jgi:hypothetical protein